METQSVSQIYWVFAQNIKGTRQKAKPFLSTRTHNETHSLTHTHTHINIYIEFHLKFHRIIIQAVFPASYAITCGTLKRFFQPAITCCHQNPRLAITFFVVAGASKHFRLNVMASNTSVAKPASLKTPPEKRLRCFVPVLCVCCMLLDRLADSNSSFVITFH
jgi:hypothetical protein